MQQLLRQLGQRLFRWQSDGTRPVELGQRRIFILPSGAGLRFAALLIVMLLAAINYQLALGHALVFLLAGLGLVAMIHTFRNLYRLQILPGHGEPVFAGETARFLLHLQETAGRPRPDLHLEAVAEHAIRVDLPAHGTRTAELPVPTSHRGWLALPRVRLSTGYPLGLFTAWSYLQPDIRTLVYPAPIDRPLPWTSAAGAEDGNTPGSGDEDFAGLRERQPADASRHIAWKAAARDDGQRPLLVKTFAAGAAPHLCLRWEATDPEATAEIRLSQLCGWVLQAESAALTYALELPGHRTNFDRGPAHRRHCLELLALYTA